ncbi:nicotinamide riboside transporter PnuC [Pontibacter sp. H249]|uniref:nicotinamide riboside transporter PnuC n=1 Tax=Pontibacter sp. H249 TaxID=3133420 RepID=UPI0030BE495A
MDTTSITQSIVEAVQAMSLLELAGALTGVAGVWLAARQSVLTWPVSLVSVAIYVVIFYDVRLYADMGLNAFYVITSFYGWYIWLYGGKGHTERKVGHVGRQQLAILIVLGTAFTLGLGYFLENYTNADLSYTDSATTAISLIGYWMMAKKYIENWIVWLVVDVVYVGVYTYKELYITSVLYFIFLILCVVGYIDWKKSLTERERKQVIMK